MKRFWQILAALMLALMVPASLCCLGADGCLNEAAGHCLTQDHDGHGHDEEEHHAPSSCPGATLSHSQVPAPVSMPEMHRAELEDPLRAMIRLQDELDTDSESSGILMATAPPELRRATWHLTSRAALLARAPSMLV